MKGHLIANTASAMKPTKKKRKLADTSTNALNKGCFKNSLAKVADHKGKAEKKVSKAVEDVGSPTTAAIWKNATIDEEAFEFLAGNDSSDQDDKDDTVLAEHSDNLEDFNSLQRVEFNEDEVATHQLELQKLKERDPQFYQFLRENDESLLDFKDRSYEEEEALAAATRSNGAMADDKEMDKTGKAKKIGDSFTQMLTEDRFADICEMAITNKSFKSLRLLLLCYKCAVTTLCKSSKNDSSFYEPLAKRKNTGSHKVKSSAGATNILEIKDDMLLLDIIKTTCLHICSLFYQHSCAHEMLDNMSVAVKDVRMNPSDEEKDLAVSDYPRWNRSKVFVKMFWNYTAVLLSYPTHSSGLYEVVLPPLSTQDTFKWICPFDKLRKNLIKSVIKLWATNASHIVRLNAYMCIRRYCSFVIMPQNNKIQQGFRSANVKTQSQDDAIMRGLEGFQSILKQMYGAYLSTVKAGFSWSTYNALQFLENSYVELLAVDEDAAYRMGFLSIRQIAVLIRNGCLVISQNQANKKEKIKKQYRIETIYKSIYCWSCILSLRLWASAIKRLPKLLPLAYPLITTINAIIKLNIVSLTYAPYNCHLLTLLCTLSLSTNKFIPVASYIFNIMDSLSALWNKVSVDLKRGKLLKKATNGKLATATVLPKPVDLDITLKLSAFQLTIVKGAVDAFTTHLFCLQTLENLFSKLEGLLKNHLGIICRHPSFPEIVLPLVSYLKKIIKSIKSDSSRNRLKMIVALIEETSEIIKQRRFDMDISKLSVGKLLVYGETDLPLSLERVAMVKESDKVFHTKTSIERHSLQEEAKKGNDTVNGKWEQPNGSSEKKRLKRLRQKEKKKWVIQKSTATTSGAKTHFETGQKSVLRIE